MAITIISRQGIIGQFGLESSWLFEISASDAANIQSWHYGLTIDTLSGPNKHPSLLSSPWSEIYSGAISDPYEQLSGGWKVTNANSSWYITFMFFVPGSEFTNINNWTNFSWSSSGGGGGNTSDTRGESVNIKIQSMQDAALFLATDFLDLSGINNENIYRNPSNLNYCDPSFAPGLYPSSSVFICKKTKSDAGTIGEYNSISGGFTNGNNVLNPGWEWGERSFLVRDNNQVGRNQSVYNYLINIVHQDDSTCAWYPATKAISTTAGAIPGSCEVLPSTDVTITYLKNITGLDNTTDSLPYSYTSTSGQPFVFTVTFITNPGYVFDTTLMNNITMTSSSGTVTITNRALVASNQIDLEMTDLSFGPTNVTLNITGDDALYLAPLVDSFESVDISVVGSVTSYSFILRGNPGTKYIISTYAYIAPHGGSCNMYWVTPGGIGHSHSFSVVSPSQYLITIPPTENGLAIEFQVHATSGLGLNTQSLDLSVRDATDSYYIGPDGDHFSISATATS